MIPLVALHGFGGTPEDWIPTLDRLDRFEPLARPWLPGHGVHPAPESFDDALERLLAALPAPPCALVGYSMGGRLALGVLARAPERVLGVALVGGHPGLSTPEERLARAHLDDHRAEALTSSGDAFWEAWDTLPLLAVGDGASEAFEAHRRRRSAHRDAGLAAAIRNLSTGRMPDLSPSVMAPPKPLALFAGERDEHYRRLYASFDTPAHREVIRGAGHRVLLESPAPLAEALDAWAPRLR